MVDIARDVLKVADLTKVTSRRRDGHNVAIFKSVPGLEERMGILQAGWSPPSFTALAFLGMAQEVTAMKIFSTYITLNGVVGQTLIPNICN
jgi:hypothetical protein